MSIEVRPASSGDIAALIAIDSYAQISPERRAEIGTRRAVGATRRAIFAGFLIEALVMTLSGGVIGIGVAWALTKIAIFIPQVPVGARPHISLVTAGTALALLTCVGLIAGVWPARRAAAVFPAEALRAD